MIGKHYIIGRPGPVRTDIKYLSMGNPVFKDKWVKFIFRHASCVFKEKILTPIPIFCTRDLGIFFYAITPCDFL